MKICDRTIAVLTILEKDSFRFDRYPFLKTLQLFRFKEKLESGEEILRTFT